jgi:hypothetical protein
MEFVLPNNCACSFTIVKFFKKLFEKLCQLLEDPVTEQNVVARLLHRMSSKIFALHIKYFVGRECRLRPDNHEV